MRNLRLRHLIHAFGRFAVLLLLLGAVLPSPALAAKRGSVTTITSIAPEPSSIGQLYTVTVQVTHAMGTTGTPNGTVAVDDGMGSNCVATLGTIGQGAGSCQLASNTIGTLTITANYSGSNVFSPSSTTAPHGVIGNHIAILPNPPPNVLQGDQLNGVTVQVQDASNAVVTTDNTTQVTLSVVDTCGNMDTFGTLTVSGGVADFTGVGPHFYTIATGLQLSATSTASGNASSGMFDVVTNTVDPLIFADGFEVCRL